MASQPVAETGTSGRKILWAAMIAAVAMIFIDQTIVAIAIPEMQEDLSLSSTGIQWVITGYLVSTAAFIAFAGRLGDMFGHRTMVMLGVSIFAVSSLLCGLTPETGIAEEWMIFFRIVQGLGGALLFPAALTLIANAYPVGERGKAIASFFIVTGLATAIGPIAGGFLAEWTWRSIFWINIPVSILALVLTLNLRPAEKREPQRIDFRGLAMLVLGMALLVVGFQESSDWGWDSPATWAAIVAGAALMAGFFLIERAAEEPLIRVRLFANRAFAADSIAVLLTFGLLVPVFFFSSMYSQISLEYPVSEAGLYLAIFFGGWALGSRSGGGMLDSIGVKRPAVIGGVVGAVGFVIWGMQIPDDSLNSQWYGMVIAGAGMGMVISATNTDALNRVPAAARGEASGILMTFRNLGSAIGLAVLGTLMITTMHNEIDEYLAGQGASQSEIEQVNDSLTASGAGDSRVPDSSGKRGEEIYAQIKTDFSDAVQLVMYVMAGVMAVVFVISLILMRRGRAEAPEPAQPAPATGA
jgi:EmrB/QacA subfamily drug resistance transporter